LGVIVQKLEENPREKRTGEKRRLTRPKTRHRLLVIQEITNLTPSSNLRKPVHTEEEDIYASKMDRFWVPDR